MTKPSSKEVKNLLSKLSASMESPQVNEEFTVAEFGALSFRNFDEPKFRHHFYDYVYDSLSDSVESLIDAYGSCQPLKAFLSRLFFEHRDYIEACIKTMQNEPNQQQACEALKLKLESMGDDPESGLDSWLLSLTNKELSEVQSQVEEWFSDSPNWDYESDYFPSCSTSQSAALNFFEAMDPEERELLGVVIVEGDCPGSTYYAAELTIPVKEANKAAEAAGIAIRFF